MSPELQTVIKQYNALPEPIQQTVFYGNIPNIVNEIGAAFGLNNGQLVALENEVTLILLLLVPRETLEQTLSTTFARSNEDAATIAFLLDNAIFVPTFERLARETFTGPAPAPETTPTPEAGEKLPAMRTMASDQAVSVPDYTSLSQDELMGHRE